MPLWCYWLQAEAGVRTAKPKMSLDVALKTVPYQVAVSSPKLKAILFGKNVCIDGCLIMSKDNLETPMAFSN